MLNKVYIKTYGCQMNEYDSSRILDLLDTTMNLKPTTEPEKADLLLLNTCSVREKAQEKVFSDLGRWKKLKTKKPHLVIGVGGCVASQEGKAILQRAPYVDLVFGPQTIHRLYDMLQKIINNKQSKLVDISFPEIEKFDKLPTPKVSSSSAYISIMEGCNKYCSYCIVPYTRGEEINRSFEDIICEAYQLATQGVKEITLLGQNVNAYRSKKADGQLVDLALLLQYIAEIDGIERLRFTTSHPVEFSDNLIQAYAQTSKLVNHLHLPVQSGSDRILARMKRGHTALEYKSQIRKLRNIRSGISISSDFIVGFPGETDQDFADTLQLVKDVNFDSSYSFIYSKRPGTPATNYPDDVALTTKKQRLYALQELLTKNATNINNSMLNTIQQVLVTGPSKKDPKMFTGRTENNRVVNFAASNKELNQIVPIKITKVLRNSLVGVVS